MAAIKLNDEPHIIQFRAQVQSIEGLQYLMEKEIRTHKQCYAAYIRCLESSTDQDSFSSSGSGDFDAVKKIINDSILHCNNAVSMANLHEFYKTGFDNFNAKVYRSRLKDRIKSEFEKELLFLTIDGKTPEVVVSSEGINSYTIHKNKNEIIKQCAKPLRAKIWESGPKSSVKS